MLSNKRRRGVSRNIDTEGDAAKGKKSDDGGEDGIFTGSRTSINVKADEAQQPLELTVHTDDKGKVIGVELAGYVLPLTPIKSPVNKLNQIPTSTSRAGTASFAAWASMFHGDKAMTRRVAHIWRDDDNRVYAKDDDSGETYYFLDYAGASTAPENKPLQTIVATEFMEDILGFTRWMAGETPPFNYRLSEQIPS
jgi:hypothetical protein